MKSVKSIIKARMEKLDLGPYDLAKLLRGKMSPQAVYKFIKHDGEIGSDRLAYVLEALDLKIVGEDEIGLMLDSAADSKTCRYTGRKRKQTRTDAR
jgi:hypothetical protein